MVSAVQIGARTVGDGHPVFVIAELSANPRTLALCQQRWRLLTPPAATSFRCENSSITPPGDNHTVRSDLPEFQISSGSLLWDGRQLYDLYEEAMTPWEWTGSLIDRIRGHGMEWFSSPFDETAVEFLETFDPPAYKIASFELVDLPLIRMVASTGRPLVMSTGMASIEEIDDAVAAARGVGCEDLVLLRCNSGYPAAS